MSSLGKNFRITIFGASHGEAIGVVMEGLPVGFAIDMDALGAFLTRRAPGRGAFATARRESDAPLFLSGVKNGVTCGGAVTAVIRNGDAHPGDYDALRNTPRPGHADFAARMKDGDAVDLSGGGRFSGRLTAPLCVAGGIAMQLLEEENIRIVSHIASIAGIADEGTGKTVPDAQRCARRGDACCHCKGTRRRRQRRRRGGVRGARSARRSRRRTV